MLESGLSVGRALVALHRLRARRGRKQKRYRDQEGQHCVHRYGSAAVGDVHGSTPLLSRCGG
ncbi:hypothetical protein [Rhizobium leguminosarum]|uniref:hypothetical protein n=1 Tax=Rhizobium leguminosarum TaxID=384 RepID=UPI001C984FB0|nr:hypothetical protein [Rhizobium leguminosarum]